jgi:hypothetical protein
MRSRLLHAALACSIFLVGAAVYRGFSPESLDLMRVAVWSAFGVASYIVLSQWFGFDPYRTRVAQFAPALTQYVDRWELRLGQATLSMLGVVALAAGLADPAHFVTAVVCGTLSAWTYFAFRLSAGGYRETRAR